MQNLKDKVAVVFAASGEIAGAVAQSFSQPGAKVYVTARNLEAVNTLAQEIKANGRCAEAAKTVATFEQFMAPMEKICGSQFLTSRVAAKYMMQPQSEGTILLLTAALSRSKLSNVAGITAASVAIEGLTRVMATEWGGNGIKVICICPGALMETKRISGWIDAAAQQYRMPPEQLVAQYKAFDILKTSPTLKQVGETAAFLASETGVAFNSHIIDVDCGKLNIL